MKYLFSIFIISISFCGFSQENPQKGIIKMSNEEFTSLINYIIAQKKQQNNNGVVPSSQIVQKSAENTSFTTKTVAKKPEIQTDIKYYTAKFAKMNPVTADPNYVSVEKDKLEELLYLARRNNAQNPVYIRDYTSPSTNDTVLVKNPNLQPELNIISAENKKIQQKIDSLYAALASNEIKTQKIAEKEVVLPVVIQKANFHTKSIYFRTGQSKVTDAEIQAILNEYPAILQAQKVIIEGFASPTGNADVNYNLVKNRTLNVYQALLKKGVPIENISYQFKGIDYNVTDMKKAQRVDVSF